MKPSQRKLAQGGNIGTTGISKEDYLKDAKNFINLFEEKKIKKAVFSRVKKIAFDESKINELFASLCDTYPKAFC